MEKVTVNLNLSDPDRLRWSAGNSRERNDQREAYIYKYPGDKTMFADYIIIVPLEGEEKRQWKEALEGKDSTKLDFVEIEGIEGLKVSGIRESWIEF